MVKINCNYNNLNGFEKDFPRKEAITFLEKLSATRGFGLKEAEYFTYLKGGEEVNLNDEYPGFFEGDFEELREEVMKYRSWNIHICEEGEGLLYIIVILSRREKE